MAECKHGLEDYSCALCRGTVRPLSGRERKLQAFAHFDVETVDLEAPYDDDFVFELKTSLPARARRWDAARRVWVIDAVWWPRALEVVTRHFDLA